MACFLVPAAEAVVTTIVTKVVKKNEHKVEAAVSSDEIHTEAPKIKLSEKLSWLNKMLWGGVALLLLEHIWHGEVVPWFPFLTAMNDPEETSQMLHEMFTVGVGMAVLVTAVWVGMCMVSNAILKRSPEPEKTEEYAS